MNYGGINKENFDLAIMACNNFMIFRTNVSQNSSKQILMYLLKVIQHGSPIRLGELELQDLMV